jgi:hypothetical protein
MAAPARATTGRRDWSAVPWDVLDEKAPDVAAQLRAEREREGWG